jgi:hypothetical protein
MELKFQWSQEQTVRLRSLRRSCNGQQPIFLGIWLESRIEIRMVAEANSSVSLSAALLQRPTADFHGY